MVGDFFGRKQLAKIRGSMSFFFTSEQRHRPGGGRRDLDRRQTYEPMLWGLVVMFSLAALLCRLLGKPWAPPAARLEKGTFI
jgi:hypothetical protein